VIFENEFENLTMEEFNRKYRLNATKEMDIENFTDYLESNGLNYFYVSYLKEDVLKSLKDEWNIVEQLKIDYLCIEGLYIAIY